MDRRRFIGLCASSIMAARAHAQDTASEITTISAVPPLPKDLRGLEAQPAFPYVDTGPVGTGKPNDAEMIKAFELLKAAPFRCRPLEVAQYFGSVADGKLGEEAASYTREWPVRANPLIFHFFAATKTKPEGDRTPWCAAFLNWCILRSHAASANEVGKAPGGFSYSGMEFALEKRKKFSTNSASSGSFRCWTKTDDPVAGDIAVFADKGTEHMTPQCLGKGHVAFFLKRSSDNKILVLGGNQILGSTGGAVTVAEFRVGERSRFFNFVRSAT